MAQSARITDKIGCWKEWIASSILQGQQEARSIMSEKKYVAYVGSYTHGPSRPVSYTHLRSHETIGYLVCRLLI